MIATCRHCLRALLDEDKGQGSCRDKKTCDAHIKSMIAYQRERQSQGYPSW